MTATPVWGQDVLHWDVNGTSLGEGGTDAWNQTSPIWSLSTDGVSGPYRPWDNLALDDAVFAGTAGTVTVSTPITVHNIAFQTNGYTITAGTLTLDGVDPTLSVTTGASTIASTINGTGRVIKAGGGTLTLSGNNSFTGGLTVNAGTLSLTGSNSFGSGPIVNGGALSLTGDNSFGSSPIVNAGSLTLNGTNSFVGNININGQFTASGAAALGAAGNNINITAGGLNIGTAGGDLTGRTVTIATAATAQVTVGGAGIGSAYFTGAGGLSASGVALNNDTNDYTGRTSFGGGSSFTSIGNLGEASSLGAPTTVANGTISITGGNSVATPVSYLGDGDVSNRNWSFLSFARAAILSNNGTGTLTLTGAMTVASGSQGTAAQFQAVTADLELLGVISGGNVAFSANAGRSVTLGDANSFTGNINISGAGKVEAATLANYGTASSLGTGGTASGISIGGTLSYTGTGASSNRNWSIGNGTLSNDGTGAMLLSGGVGIGGNATLGGSFTDADNVLSGVISGTGNLRGAGAGTWVVSGANSYTGSTIVDSGTLRAGAANAFTSSTRFQVNGGTLDLDGFDQTLTTLTGTGGTLDLGSALLTIEAPIGTTASFAGSIVGTGGLTKLGASTQTLTGASTYTGDTIVGGGILALDFSPAGGPASDIIGSDSTLNMAGGRLNLVGAAGEANTQTFDGLTITAGNNTINATSGTGGSLTVNLGAITRSGGLMNFNLPTSGNITTTNTSLGGWATVNGTDYAKVVGGNILAFTEADYTDKDNAANWLDNEFITDVSGFFGTVNGTRQLGGLRYTQPVSTIVTINPGETLGVDGTIIVAPTVLGTNQLITGGAMTGANGGVLGVQQNGTGNFTITSQIVDNGPGMGFTKAGTGLVTLTNTANSYTGATNIVQGTLAVTSIGNGGVASSIGASAADSSNLVLEGSTLRYTGTGDISDRGFTFAKSGAILGVGVEVTNANANLVFSGLVTSPDDATFTKSGAGTLTLANPNNDFTGTVAVTGGLLAIDTLPNGGVVSPIGQSSSAPASLTLSSGGGLRYTGATTTTNRGFTLATGGGVVDVGAPGTTLTVGGQVVGAGSLTKNGAGTLILTAANTYTGGNTVNSGILRAGAANVLGSSGPMTLANAAGVLLDLNNFNNAIGALNGGGANGGNVTLGSARLQINGGNGNYSGTISGTGGILRTGGGTQTFNGCNNSYTGATTLQGGDISTDCLADGGVASGIGASGAASTNLVFNGGSLTYTGGSVAIDRGFQLLGAGGINVTNAGTTLEFEGAIIGGGGLIKRNAGTLVLSGANTYTGNTQVEGGVLRAGAANAFGPQGEMTLNNTAGVLLDLDGFDTVVSSLNGGGANGGNIDLGSATLTILDGINRTYAGAIIGSGNLVKSGTRIQALSGCNSSYTGSTRIDGGTLQVTCLENGGVNSSIGASSADPANLVINGTLRYIGAATSTDRQFTIGASGATLDSSGTGPVEFTYAGAATLAGGASLRAVTLTGTNTGVNLLAARLDDNGAGVTSLTKTGTGTWRLTNQASSYSGATTISGGILIVDKLADGGQGSTIGASSNAAANLVIGNGSTLRYVGAGDVTDRQFTLDTGVTFIESSGTGALVFENTGTVGLTGTNATRTIALGGTNTGFNTMGGAIGDNGTGATTLAKNDSGTWVLTGNNSYTGNTVINDGNLMIGNGGATGNAGAGNVIVDSPTSILSLNRSDTFTFGGTLSGPGTLAQIGSGTSILTSALNNIGATTISAGALQVNGGLITPTIAMTGTSTLTVNGLVRAGVGSPAALSGDGGASTIAVNAGGVLTTNGDLGDGVDTVSLAGTLATGGAALNLGLGNDTLILRDGGAITGTGVNAGAGTDALVVDNALAYSLDSAGLAGFESLTKQNGGVLTLTGNHSYGAGTTIAAGTLRVGNGGLSGTLAGDISNNAALEFNRLGTLTIAGQISGTGSVNQIGPGTTILTGAHTYAGGTTISAGTLQIGDGSITGSIVGEVVNNGTLAFNRSDDLAFDGLISGTGALRKLGAGTLTLTANNSYTGLTTIAAGTLQLGDGGTSGTLAGNVLNNGVLAFDRADALSFTGFITGSGGVDQAGTGTTILTGTNSYAGATNVNSGTLLVDGDQSAATGLTSIASGATLGGNGTIGGDVALADGATLAPGSNGAGSLAINGGLSLAGTSQLDFEFGLANAPGDPLNDVVDVGGDLALDGALNVAVSPGGGFDIGLYRIINYGGALDNNGLDIGTLPAGVDPNDVFVQTSIAGQVNLINANGVTLNFWDGAAGPKFNNAVNGGDGIWQNSTGNDNWADVSGAVNAPFTDSAIAIFSAALGTVTVDDSLGAVSVGGMQFASNGYVITGDAVTLTNPQSVIRVGDGTGAGASYRATINSVLTGAGVQLVKTDLGTLVLTAANTYAGGTLIDAGTLSISSDANLGDAAGVLSLDGGTLNTTADIASSRAVDLLGTGAFATDAGTALTLNGVVSGAGALAKDGAGTLVLTAANTYAGGTAIDAGILQLGNGGTTGSIAGDVVNNATLAFNRSDSATFAGTLSGSGGVNQIGTGTTILTAANTYTGGTLISAGTLQFGDGGTSGSIVGDITNGGTLIFNRSNEYSFAGTISGAGAVRQEGAGTTILTAANSYTGSTVISSGTLLINGNQTAAVGTTNVLGGGTLGGTGTIGGDVFVGGGATLTPGDATGPGTLTINGNLGFSPNAMLAYDFGQSNIVGGPLNDLTEVAGDLTLDGTIDVTVAPGGSFDVGVYRVISYGGTLTDNVLDIGADPSGGTVSVQTSVANQINLVNTAGLTLNFWDGAAGPKFDGAVNGGDGIWQNSTGNDNWTEETGGLNAAFADAAFAIFSAAPGTVEVDNDLGQVSASGMQFASDGYVITGDALNLVGPQSVIRVGDGTADGATYVATIATGMTGAGDLAKTDLGTLVLTGDSTIAGYVYANAGEVRLADGGTLESANASIGPNSGNQAIVTVTGADGSGAASTWTVGGDLEVGYDGAGTLNIADGGRVTSNVGYIGRGTDGIGLVRVTGPGSTWENTGRIIVGDSGTGSLRVEDGAVVSSQDGQVGASGQGDVVVSGAGTSWTNAEQLTVGSFGAGTMRIENGASVTSNQGFVGANADGSVVVTGTGSNWLVTTFSMTVGNDGTGALTIADGGRVRAEGGFLLGNTVASGGTVAVLGTAGSRGVLETSRIGAGLGVIDFSLDGGVLRATQDADDFFVGFDTHDLTLGAGGGIVDTDGNDIGISPRFVGTGGLTKDGLGTLRLSGANSYAGATLVNAGTLLVNGDQSAATGLTTVLSGATLGGNGIIGGDVDVLDGGTLAPGESVGTLTINGDLSLTGGSILTYEFGQANVAGGALNDLVNVGGDLVLDGTIDVSVPAGGSFGPGVYRVFNYGGALTDNGLGLGRLPAGSDVAVQTSIAGQVNLVNAAGLALTFWDGDAGPKNDGVINGGDGVWRLAGGSNNWTDSVGGLNASYAQDGFAVFAGAAGNVTVDDVGGAVGASGMQFASDGYVIAGDAITLADPQTVIRVGDGSVAGAGFTARVDAELTGSATLVKTDAGMLVLGTANSYTGGTAIDGGTLRIASDANLGDVSGGVSLNGGTLNTTADLVSARAVALGGPGALLTDTTTTLTLTGTLSGVGALTKSGAGTLVLGGTGNSTGTTSVNAGTLLVNGDYAGVTGTVSVANGARLGGTGTIGGDVTLADGATLTPGAGAPGTFAIAGDLSLASGARLDFEFGLANIAGGALNDLVNVGGDLVLDGTIDVAVPAGGGFGAGVYRVFNYGGTLTDNGLNLGLLPPGSEVTVQTSIAGQVNLVNAEGANLTFWDGATGPKNNGVVNGGTGVWQNSAGNDNWTESTGTVNAAYDDASFAIFAGTGGTVTVDNSLGDVTSGGMQFAVGDYRLTGDNISLVGPQTTIRVGDGTAAGAGMTATIDTVLQGATRLIKTDAGTLVLGGTNTYTGGTLINGGTVQVASDANLGAVDGAVTLDGGTLGTSANLSSGRDLVMTGSGTISTANATTFTYNGLISGPGALTKAGAGTLLVTGDNDAYTGDATVAGGTLTVLGSLGSAVSVNDGGRLEGTGRVGDLINDGVVAPGRDGFGTLTVAGSYAGQSGILEIETELGGDSSQTDRLVIGGGTSGSTEVVVTNRGGLGAQTSEGIRIIDITGGASTGTFILRGDYVFEGSPAIVAGAYGYRLFQGGISTPTDGDWYLRSALLDEPNEPQAPLYQPGVPLYESYAQTLQTLNGLGTLQERVGNRQWSGFTQGGIGMWGRIEASRHRPEAAFSTSGSDLDVNDWSLQAGFDAALHDSNAGTLIAGINGRYGKADARVRSRFGNGDIDTRGYGVGATLTWYSAGGFYADAQAQLSWYRSDLTSGILGELIDNNHGSGDAFSLEVGKRAPLGGGLSVTPQIQMVYSNVHFDRFADPNDAAVSARQADSLRSRWGISLDHQRTWDTAGDTRRSHVYAIANLHYEWLDGSVVEVSGTPLARRDDRLRGELGIGGSYSWADGRYTIFSEASAATAINGFGDSNTLRANAGFRMRF